MIMTQYQWRDGCLSNEDLDSAEKTAPCQHQQHFSLASPSPHELSAEENIDVHIILYNKINENNENMKKDEK